jgi:hypothetical protein
LKKSTKLDTSYGLPRQRSNMTPEEKRELERRDCWQGRIYVLDQDCASLVDAPTVPIIGQQVDLALEYATAAAVAMMRHPDPAVCWTHDTVLILDGRIIGLVRVGVGPPEIVQIGIDAVTSNQGVRPGHRVYHQPRITFVDGSLRSRDCGEGVPLAGRDLITVVEAEIEAVCQSMQCPDPEGRQALDVALSYQGRVLAVIKVGPEGPVVHRFDPLDADCGRRSQGSIAMSPRTRQRL